MKKRCLALLCLLVMLLASLPTAQAADDITVLLNGAPVEFPDQKPIIVDSRTLVPFRAIFEALGCTVEWDGINRAVYGTFQEGEFRRVMSLFIGRPVVMYTDQVAKGERIGEIQTSGVILDVAPDIYNDRTLVPLRAVSEILGATVGWNGDTRTVTIDTGDTFSAYKQVSEESIQTYIAQNLHGAQEFVVTVDKGLKPAEMDALIQEAVDKAKGDFAQAAAVYDEGIGAQSHVFSKGSVDPDLEKLVLGLKSGEVGSVLLSDGYHIVKKMDLNMENPAAVAAALKELSK